MSRRFWVHIVAAGSIAVSAVVGPVVAQIAEGQKSPNEVIKPPPPDAATSSDAVDSQASNPEILLPYPLTWTGRVSKSTQTSYEAASGDGGADQEANELARRDLSAQESMADSAIRMLEVAWWQTGSTLAGLLFIAATLYYTRKAVVEAANANATSRNAVAFTQKLGERQIRAYVHVSEVHLQYVNDEWKPTVSVVYQNFGQSPARRVINNLNVTFIVEGKPENRTKVSTSEDHGFTLGPSQDRVTSVHTSFSGLFSRPKMLEQRLSTMYVHGEITYVDVFDQIHFTRYRFSLHVPPEGLSDTTSFLICDDGNESN